jgi:hypothetical protein
MVSGQRGRGPVGDRKAGRGDLLSLIRERHAEYDVRRAVSTAIHHAEVALLGSDFGGLALRLNQRLVMCGGHLVEELTRDTRFAVPSPRATQLDIDAAGEWNAELVSERELGDMIDIYVSVCGLDELRSAARRARDDATRQGSPTVAEEATKQPEAAPARKRGFHTSERKDEPERKPLTDEERSLEEHARRVRSADAHGAFRYHREPL